MKGGERGGCRGLDRFGQALLGGEVGGTEEGKAIDEQDLLSRRTADQSAVLELRGR